MTSQCSTLKIAPHPLSEFSREFALAFAKEVLAERVKGAKELEGKKYEQILCDIYGTDWKGSNNGLVDVKVGDIGYSVKSKLHNVKGDPAFKEGVLRRVSTIVGRNSPDTFNGGHIEKNVTPANEAGKTVIDIWNDRWQEATSLCLEFRQLTILKSTDLCSWLLFEFSPKLFAATDFEWCWAEGKGKGKKKKTINLYGVGKTNDLRLTWQPNGSQFTLNQQIPEKHLQFCLKKDVEIITNDVVLKQIGYSDEWITMKRIGYDTSSTLVATI